jgi:hypothetical protein
MLEFNMIDTKATIEVDEYGPTAQIVFNDGESKLSITFTQSNLEYLRQKLSPQGLIPDDFPMKIVMMNQLIEDIEDIRDKNDPSFELDKVYYNKDEDKKKGLEADTVYFDCKEVS